MSLWDQNKMLYILHRNGVSRKNILFIMNDLKTSETFGTENDFEDEFEDDWELVEQKAFLLFESNVSSKAKILALRNIKKKEEEFENTRKCQYLTDQEGRIQTKRKELIEQGVIEPDKLTHQKTLKLTTRYGRSPLHEAIAMKDIHLVKKYLKSGKYLEDTDHNGHTALEMAYYDNYKEALLLFLQYSKDKIPGSKKFKNS